MRGFKPLTITADMVVDTNLFDVAPAIYPSGFPFVVNSYTAVAGLLGEIKIYKNILADTTGTHAPASSPTYWVYVSSTYEVYSSTKVYALGYRVLDTDTLHYKEATIDGTSGAPLDGTPKWLYMGKAVNSGATEYNGTIETHNGSGGYTAIGANYYVNAQVGFSNQDQYRVDVYKVLVDYPIVPPPNAEWSYVTSITGTYGLWDSKRRYALGYLVVDEYQNIYKSLVGNNLNNKPATPQVWLDLGPSNLMAMFDGEITAASKASQELTVTVASGIVDTVGLMGVYGGVVTCTVRDGLGGTVVFEETKGLSGNIVADWWDFIYADPEFPRKKAVFENIPPYVDSHVTITVEGDAEVRIGALLMGQQKSLGIGAKYGASVSVVDLSKTDANAFGDIKFTQGRYYERLDLNVMLRKVDFNRVHLELTDMRGQPWFLVVSDDPDLSEALLMYGFYKNYRNVIDYPNHTLYSLEFESLVNE